MTKTQVVLLRSCHDDFQHTIDNRGPIVCFDDAATRIVLSRAPSIQVGTGKVRLSRESIQQMEHMLALSCTYDCGKADTDAVRHQIKLLEIAFQLTKPTCSFLQLWMQLDSDGLTEMVNRPVSDLGRELGPDPYLQYQQHNSLTESDVRRALAFVHRLATALDRRHGSWEHPLLSIHRALMFFCQGYTITPRDPCQFFWAAGLDCLFASKIDRDKQGSWVIGKRWQRLLGPGLKLYEADTVSLPCHQTTRTHQELGVVTADMFKLRNAFAHGLRMPDQGWFSDVGQPAESGYACQLQEQAEIALRLTLLKILEDQDLFDTFSDPDRLDAYFS